MWAQMSFVTLDIPVYLYPRVCVCVYVCVYDIGRGDGVGHGGADELRDT